MPSFPELTEPLQGRRARLRLVAERDIPEMLIAYQDDPELHLRIGLVRPPSGAQLGRRVETGPAERAAGTGMWLAIVPLDSDECCGQVDVHAVEWDHLRAEVGIWVAPGRRRQGVGGDALAVAARWLLRACGLERVQLITEPDNTAMIRAARAAGFAEEGILRGYVRERGRRVDVVMMSLVRRDLS